MDITLAPGFQKEFPDLLDKVRQDVAQMLDIDLEIDIEREEIRSMEDLYRESGEGIVCCRSIFVRKVNGIGGLIVPEKTADALSRAAMMMDPPTLDSEIDFDGLVREAMEEIFNVFVGSWNTNSSPDYRLGSKNDERSVELYPTQVEFPPESGVFPYVLYFPLTVTGILGYIALLLPIKGVHGREVAMFTPPEGFNPISAPSVAPPSRAPSPAPVVPEVDPNASTRPVVFLDYSGQVLPWLRAAANQPQFQCLLAKKQKPDSLPEHPTPIATIIVGSDADSLHEHDEISVIEIHPRTG